MENDVQGVLDLDRLIHEPARLVLISILYTVDSADFLYLMRETGLTRGNLSSHLARLEEGGYVAIEKTYKHKTPMTILHITDAGRDAYKKYSESIRLALLPEAPRGFRSKK